MYPTNFFYPKGSLVNVNEWTEANLSEDIFMHASDPAGISFSQKEEPDNLTIYWLSDLRNTVADTEVDGYHVYRKMPFEKEFSRMTPTPVTANSFVDQTAQEYEGNSYKVTSIINGQEQIYSWDVTFTNQTIEIYSLNWHVEIPEG